MDGQRGPPAQPAMGVVVHIHQAKELGHYIQIMEASERL